MAHAKKNGIDEPEYHLGKSRTLWPRRTLAACVELLHDGQRVGAVTLNRSHCKVAFLPHVH